MKQTFRLGPSPLRLELDFKKLVSLSTMPQIPKLERLLIDCFELLDQEASALASEDLERVSEVLKIKESSFASLNSLLEDEPVETSTKNKSDFFMIVPMRMLKSSTN